MNVFVSYARRDHEEVMPVVQGLRLLGKNVWFDEALVGGQAWWDGILGHIRACDVFVQGVTRRALESEACTRERRYAVSLGKPILPVLVEAVPTDVLPAELATVQFVDYTSATSESAFQLAAALEQCPPARPLPQPLPPPPPIPISYLGELGEKISAPQLSLDDQLALVARLRTAAEQPEQHEGAVELLRRLQQRNDLFHAAARQIDSALMISPYAGRGARGQAKAPAGAGAATPRSDGASLPPPPPPPTYGPPPTPGTGASQGAPSVHAAAPAAPLQSHLGLAILGAFLFFPTGLFSIINAARVGPALQRGDHAGAAQASSRALTFFWVSVGVFVLLVLLIAGSGEPSTTY
jgi:hypothetical protein